eukprot:TRINITY_DN30280_c0_g1_i1.p1 TRINITY_DN30280_c0_g1~~TRINITY_DN30280_c0_g1_i1.p1  ORF type:complete len:204 (-),score=20.42 TRINITY_DN30280_c0_g1_i1:512-1123(-)
MGVTEPASIDNLYRLNDLKSRGSAYLSQHVRFKLMEASFAKKCDPDYAWKSNATNFARGGFFDGKKNYIRDPRSGVWFLAAEHDFPGMVSAPFPPYLSNNCGTLPNDRPAINWPGNGHPANDTMPPLGLTRTNSAPGQVKAGMGIVSAQTGNATFNGSNVSATQRSSSASLSSSLTNRAGNRPGHRPGSSVRSFGQHARQATA